MIINTLIESSLLLLFLVSAVGYAIGRIRIKGASLGVAAVLFVGLAVGALDPNLKIPQSLFELGLVLFVYYRRADQRAGLFCLVQEQRAARQPVRRRGAGDRRADCRRRALRAAAAGHGDRRPVCRRVDQHPRAGQRHRHHHQHRARGRGPADGQRADGRLLRGLSHGRSGRDPDQLRLAARLAHRLPRRGPPAARHLPGGAGALQPHRARHPAGCHRPVDPAAGGAAPLARRLRPLAAAPTTKPGDRHDRSSRQAIW